MAEPKIERPSVIPLDAATIDADQAETAAKDCAGYAAELLDWAHAETPKPPNAPDEVLLKPAGDPYALDVDPKSVLLWLLQSYNDAVLPVRKNKAGEAHAEAVQIAEMLLRAAGEAIGNPFLAASIVPPERAGDEPQWCHGHYFGGIGLVDAEARQRLRQKLQGRSLARHDQLEAFRLKCAIERKAQGTPSVDLHKARTILRDDVAHADDFRSVNWYGTPYTFSATQAACIKIWWEHWERGTPDVGDHTILETAEVQSRLRAAFREHPAWGTMIVEGATKGTHRLAAPSE